MKRVVFSACIVVLALAGCESTGENPRELSNERGRTNTQKWRDAMVKSAVRRDMSLSDVHFVAHTTRLSSLGERRLKIMADIMAEDGGQVRMATRQGDDDFTKQRMETVVAYLETAGIPRERIDIESGVALGRGMTAQEAIEVKAQAFDPQARDLTTLIGGGEGGGLGAE